jgi:hypothetical protein
MDIAREFLGCVFVELQALSAVDFGISLPGPYAKGRQITLVLFNQPVYGFLNERIGVVIIAPRDFFADALLKLGRQSNVHFSMRALPKVDRISCHDASRPVVAEKYQPLLSNRTNGGP